MMKLMLFFFHFLPPHFLPAGFNRQKAVVKTTFCHHLPTLRGSDLSQLKSVSAIKNLMQIFTAKI